MRYCKQCESILSPTEDSKRTLCRACLRAKAQKEEITHHKLIRCPDCGKMMHPSEHELEEVYGDGEHDVVCVFCDADFQVSTYIWYTFKSPERREKK